MKKILYLSVIISMISIFSCKKEYTCRCYLKVYYDPDRPYVYDKDTIKARRRAADEHCAAYNMKTVASPDSLRCYAYTND